MAVVTAPGFANAHDAYLEPPDDEQAAERDAKHDMAIDYLRDSVEEVLAQINEIRDTYRAMTGLEDGTPGDDVPELASMVSELESLWKLEG